MYKLLITAVLTTLLLTACATAPSTNRGINPTVQQAKNFESAGQFQKAADMYWLSSKRASTEQRPSYQVKAAEMALMADNESQAKAILNRINEGSLSPVEKARKRLVEAKMANRQNNRVQVESLLSFPLSGLPTVLQQDIQTVLGHRLPGQDAESTLDPTIVAITGLMKQHASSRSNADSQAVWQKLLEMDTQSISRWLGSAREPLEKGWLELAYIHRTQHSPEALQAATAGWQGRFKTHPAWPGKLTGTAGSMISVKQIALLIPRSGPLANVSQIILNGITSAHRSNSQSQIQVKVYDSGERSDQIVDIYNTAVQQGADVIIGPIDKKAVDTLARLQLPIPVLTLNHGTETTFNANMFQFALLPEDEARLTAERIINDGHGEIIAFVPDSQWGKRVGNAFVTRIQELGGHIVEAELYDATGSDYSEPVIRALKFEKGEERHSGSRREDIDAIFVAAFPKQGRIFKPLLKFYFAEELPMYTTSHIYDGIEDKYKNRDLNEVKSLDIPWLLGQDPNPADSIPSVSDLSGNDKYYPRLFAFGIDSYNLAPRVKQLSGNSNRYMNGYSGKIYLDSNNRLHHRLLWAEFKKGILESVPMNEFSSFNNDLLPTTQSPEVSF